MTLVNVAAAAAAKSLQSCPTLCDPTDGSPPGSARDSPSNCSGAYELLGKHDEYGIVTENDEDALYEGIKRLLDDPERLIYYRKQAQIRGKDFSGKNTAEAVEDMLHRVLGE